MEITKVVKPFIKGGGGGGGVQYFWQYSVYTVCVS